LYFRKENRDSEKITRIRKRITGSVFYIFLIFSFLFLPINSFGQDEDDYDSLLIREIIVENPVYKPVVAFGAGVMNFYGDVNNSFANPMVGNFAFKVNVSTYIDAKRAFIGNFNLILGSITGNERSTTDLMRNLNFRSDIISFGVNLEYNFGHLIPIEDPVVKPFISVGFENFSFSSKGDLYDSEGRQYHYWTDGSIRDIPEADKNLMSNTILYRDWDFESDLRDLDPWELGKYSQNAFAIPFDVGIDFNVTTRVKMRLGTSFHLTFTDLIDNVSSKGIGVVGNSSNDYFSFTYLTMHLDLFSEPKVRTEELMFAELDDFDYTMFDDEDGDGVIDASDNCLGTPVGIEVDTLGCPYDDDDDGVPNYLDKELNSARGAYVNDEGVTLSEEELIAMLSTKEAVRRSDLGLYFLTSEEGKRMSLSDMPEKYQSLDTDGDNYISFDELLSAINDFFDYTSNLDTEEVYAVINFFFVQ